MPLIPGKSDKIVSHNIKEMINSGHPKAQAVAASLHNAGKSNKDKQKEGRAKPKNKKTHKETLRGILTDKQR